MFSEINTFGPTLLSISIKLLLAALCGALIGIEREKHGRPAGLRTHLIVALASCLMMVISESFYLKYIDLPGTNLLRIDPARVAAQIVAGIGFIGAGVILKEGLTVRGLTTAACLWLASAVGMGFGMGLFLPTLLSTVISIIALIFLKRLEPYIHKDRYTTLLIEVGEGKDIFPDLESLFSRLNMKITDISSSFYPQRGETHYKFILTQHRRRMGQELVREISTLQGVIKIEYQ